MSHIITFALSQLGDRRGRCSSPCLHGPEPAEPDTAQLCGWKATPLPHTAITFPAFRPVPNCTALFYFSVSCFVTVMAVSVTTLVLLLLINLDVGLDITAIKHDLEEAEAAE